MDLILILTYTAICYAVFKIFKIPVNKWSIPTAALGGVVLLSTLILLMSYNHPFTNEGRIYFPSAPVISVVRGPVIDVPVAANSRVKKGDILFRIEPRPYQYVVAQKRAALAEAEQKAKQLQAEYDHAKASVAGVTSQLEFALRRLADIQKLTRAQAATEFREQDTQVQVNTLKFQLEGALATERNAKIALDAEVEGINPTVARLQAELRDAEYDLEQTTVRAPTDGTVAQVFLRPGMLAVPLPLRPVMVFVHDERQLVGAFVQNSLQRVRVGDEAEVTFKAIPGQVFKGKVKAVIDVMAQGQLQPGGSLLDPQAPERATAGRALATIEILDDLSKYNLPGGVIADIAIYTEHWHHVAVLRKILLRMSGWLNFVFLEK